MTQARSRSQATSAPRPRTAKTGDLVHYHRVGEGNQACRAAVVTHVWSAEVVNLFVYPDGLRETNEMVVTSVPYAPLDSPGTWHFPE